MLPLFYLLILFLTKSVAIKNCDITLKLLKGALHVLWSCPSLPVDRFSALAFSLLSAPHETWCFVC
jgi:hypothetical protein